HGYASGHHRSSYRPCRPKGHAGNEDARNNQNDPYNALDDTAALPPPDNWSDADAAGARQMQFVFTNIPVASEHGELHPFQMRISKKLFKARYLHAQSLNGLLR